jgi:hypothetical protein
MTSVNVRHQYLSKLGQFFFGFEGGDPFLQEFFGERDIVGA